MYAEEGFGLNADVAFPVGHLAKAQVRALAARAGLPSAARRSSAGICFIGARSAQHACNHCRPCQALEC